MLFRSALQAHVFVRQTPEVFPGPTGLNFSSYLRDYDFRIVLPRLLQGKATAQEWNAFGKLHGMLTRRQFGSCGLITEPLAIAISLADKHSYRATDHQHPILGREYRSTATSLTDRYFAQMGLHPQFFRPKTLPAPLAIYSDQPLELASDGYLAALLAVMGNFQRIYRPEIYLSRISFSSQPGELSQANLNNKNYSLPALRYDRIEREQLAHRQARFIEEVLIKPHGESLARLLEADD